MADVDDLLCRLVDGAAFSDAASVRLEERLGREPSPKAIGRKARAYAFLAFACAASLSGALVGGLIESGQPEDLRPVLPAAQTGTAADLLLGQLG